MSDTAERVKKIVVEHLGVDESKVVENASFIDDLGADSLDTVELVMAFEEEPVPIDLETVSVPSGLIEDPNTTPDAAEKIMTVKDAIDYIEANKS